ncbi:UNVERIFIED_CONTAM: hypothetical protein HDU68_010189 [Siphonaria sp. JEL0065]|nr:hypothetical protein HDU68_010189 [Siphonaria sp. JEL0065]
MTSIDMPIDCGSSLANYRTQKTVCDATANTASKNLCYCADIDTDIIYYYCQASDSSIWNTDFTAATNLRAGGCQVVNLPKPDPPGTTPTNLCQRSLNSLFRSGCKYQTVQASKDECICATSNLDPIKENCESSTTAWKLVYDAASAAVTASCAQVLSCRIQLAFKNTNGVNATVASSVTTAATVRPVVATTLVSTIVTTVSVSTSSKSGVAGNYGAIGGLALVALIVHWLL